MKRLVSSGVYINAALNGGAISPECLRAIVVCNRLQGPVVSHLASGVECC